MLFSADLANLIFYCAQQLGVTLGVGAETIMLAAYFISMRDGVLDEKETQYARAIKRVMSVALVLIVLSGIGITVLHTMAGQGAIILTPAFLFKWLLIVLIIALTLLRKAFPATSMVEGVIGGTWYTLFLVHILAPATGWINLGILYAVWLVGFVICWETLVVLRRDKKVKPAFKLKLPVLAIKKAAPLAKPPVPIPVAPIIETKPTIVLGPDLPHVTSIPIPPPPPSVPLSSSISKGTLTPVSGAVPLGTVPPSPSHKVTDTPFLPAVPSLQPIPVIPEAALSAPLIATPVSASPLPDGISVPLTTPPGGTSAGAPEQNPGLSAFNVMPKKPADINGSK
ncbi:MAG TPA: hypothetical protein VIJ88_03065 [Candidatus Paceibacterota bacterium]